jgi:hypothetical protein
MAIWLKVFNHISNHNHICLNHFILWKTIFLAKALHTSILYSKSKIDKLEESNQTLKKKIDHMLSDQDSSLKKNLSLEDSLKFLKGHVKSYVSESVVCLFLICYARWKCARLLPNLYQLCTPFFLCFPLGDCKWEERDLM